VDDLIARVLAGDATDIEKQHLRRWTQEDPENERLFRETEAAWKAFDVLAAHPSVPAPDVSEVVRIARRRRYLPGRKALLAAAAVVVLAAAGTFQYVRDARREVATTADTAPALTLIASAVGDGGVSTLTLSDGSVVRLAPDGRLDLLPGSDGRAVALEGRAFFAVAPGSTPFTVTTPVGRMDVLGTRFEVDTSSYDGTRVVVVEGTVQLSGTWGPSERAGANTVAMLTRGARPRIDVVPDPWSLLDWPGGLLLFQATPLSDIARELERRFGVAVTVADPTLATRRVTAWFGDESLEQVLEAVCLVTNVSCRVASGAAVIGG
jgi:transmembrane sensor